MSWRRLDVAGHDTCWLRWFGDWWRLTGTAVFQTEGGRHRLEYQVTCDADWRTVAARVTGRTGGADVLLNIAVDGAQNWSMNGKPAGSVAGCVDIDLGFTPATNLLPIRRLQLAIGQTALVRSAWLEDVALDMRPLQQVYHRSATGRYAYTSTEPDYSATLMVGASGFVTDYPGLWTAIASTDPD